MPPDPFTEQYVADPRNLDYWLAAGCRDFAALLLDNDINIDPVGTARLDPMGGQWCSTPFGIVCCSITIGATDEETVRWQDNPLRAGYRWAQLTPRGQELMGRLGLHLDGIANDLRGDLDRGHPAAIEYIGRELARRAERWTPPVEKEES